MNCEGINSNKIGRDDTEPVLPLPSGKDLIKGVAIIWTATIVLGVIFAIIGHSKAQPLGAISILVTTLVSTAITFMVSWHFVCRKYKIDILKGFALYKPNKRVVIWAIAIGLIGSLVATFFMTRYGTGNSFIEKLASTPTGLAVVTIIIILVPPFEEIYYRGFIFPILQRKIGSIVAILAVVIWFGAEHVFQVSGDWIALPIIVTMGCIWTIQRYIHKSLVPSIITHWIYNIGLALIALIQTQH